MSRFRAVVFDFDFTLVDSSAGFAACHAWVMETLQLPHDEAKVQEATAFAGTPLHLAYEHLFPDHPELNSRYVELWQERADTVMTPNTVVLPGIPEMLARLREGGVGLGIVSQKRRYRIEEVLEREKLIDRFTILIGAEDVPAFKPDPRGVLLAVERIGAEPATAMYVGDTEIDAQTAQNAGLAFVAVTTGFTPPADFEPYQPLAILESAAELPNILGH